MKNADGNPLGLYAMVSAFIILGIGVGLSLLVFLLELIVHWSSTTPRRRIQITVPNPVRFIGKRKIIKVEKASKK